MMQIAQDVLGCAWEPSYFLVFSENVFASLVYYSHFFSLLAAFGLGLFVYLSNRSSFMARLFFAITTTFSLWVFSDVVLWADPNPSHIMFFWTITILLEPVLYILGLYFLMVYVTGMDVSVKTKHVMLGILVPTIALSATKFGILGFNYTNCDREVVEGLLVYYGYFVEIIVAIWTTIFAIRQYKNVGKGRKRPLVLISLGMLLFLFMFSWGNIVGTISEDWTIGQYGLFGMPILLGFMTYAIVKFRTFNIKIIGTQAIVSAQIVLLLSLLFLRQIENVRVVVILTVITFIIIGWSLVRGVKREVYQREKIQKLADDLKKANIRLTELDRQKSEFVSFATHQLRSPLTAMKGYASLILEGDMGAIAPQAKDAVSRIFESTNTLAAIVDDYLNVTRIELGSMKYAFETIDLKTLVEDVIGELKPNIDKSVNVKFTFEAENSGTDYRTTADRDKLKQVIANLIDNSLKYTPKGSVSVTLGLDRLKHKFVFKIQDTGIGVAAETLPHLFAKWSRAGNANKTNIRGTGLGLFVAKEIVVAHHGTIHAESAGEGKGSTFVVELEPFAKA
ncbi:MAG: hypothetical protein RLY66_200 [Candidatus Parcubacteria bacterium]|jgi:signal transduction histidine kinase